MRWGLRSTPRPNGWSNVCSQLLPAHSSRDLVPFDSVGYAVGFEKYTQTQWLEQCMFPAAPAYSSLDLVPFNSVGYAVGFEKYTQTQRLEQCMFPAATCSFIS